MIRLFSNILDTIKRKKAMFILLIILTIAVCVLAVYSAINFDNGIISLDIGHVSYVKFLKGAGFMSFLFNSMLVTIIFAAIIWVCCLKRFLLPFGFLFYLYFVYSQVVIFVSLILIYGFFNVLVLMLFLIVFLLFEFLIFMLILLDLTNVCGSSCYFKDCFNLNTCSFKLLICLLLILIFLFCLLLMILKSFIILLVF